MTDIALKTLERRSYQLTKQKMALNRLVDAVALGQQREINQAMLVARLVLSMDDNEGENK